jgi:hypothetical protein
MPKRRCGAQHPLHTLDVGIQFKRIHKCVLYKTTACLVYGIWRVQVFQSELVVKEFDSIMGELRQLSGMASRFPDFDLQGKEMFLDKVRLAVQSSTFFWEVGTDTFLVGLSGVVLVLGKWEMCVSDCCSNCNCIRPARQIYVS